MAPEVVSEADFRVLGLEPGSKPSEVRQAYRTLVKKWHPDRHHSKPYETRALAEKKFREIDEAYKRIARSWKNSPSSSRYPGGGARPETGPSHSAQGGKTNADALRRKINFQVPSRRKVILPALLLLALAAFFFTRHPSVSPDAVVNTKIGGPSISEGSSQPEGTNLEGPVEAPVPPSAGLRSPVTNGQKLLSDLPPPTADQGVSLVQPPVHGLFFTLGSTTSKVQAIQGTPSRIQGQTWIYGLSEVQFRNGRVVRFNNFDGSLRVRMQPGDSNDYTPPDHITIGSNQQEVLLVQGTPTRVDGNRWFYGFAELVFKNGLVSEYDNYFGTLKMRVLPSAPSGAGLPVNVFTIGSTPDEVLAAQGTPTAIHGNRWSFDFESVQFLEGKVHNVTNPKGTLHFVVPEEKRSVKSE